MEWQRYEVKSAARLGEVARASAQQKFVYALAVELGDDIIGSDTPVLFAGAERRVEGKVVGQDPDRQIVFVTLLQQIWPADLPGYLQIEKAHLVSQLADRLQSLDKWPMRFLALNGQDDCAALALVADQSSSAIADQILRLPPPWTRLLWGPPGAGKTFALAQFITSLIAADPTARVLVIAPSNRAADTVAIELARQLCAKHPDVLERRRVFRYGYARLPGVIGCAQLLGPQGQDALAHHIGTISAELARAEREQSSDERIAMLRSQLLAAQEDLKDATNSHVREASVVITTTTQTYLKATPIPNQSWHTVIIDEVTMVPPALCLFVSSLASERLLLAGDPQQLGPVFETTARTQNISGEMLRQSAIWLSQDIFVKSGVSGGSSDRTAFIKTDDRRLCRITAQRRCVGAIWEKVSALYPDVGHLTDETGLKGLADLAPNPGQAVVVMDTANNDAATCQKAGRSWKNEFTAQRALEVAVTIAAEAEPGTSVAIITPYRGQVRLLRKYIKNELSADPCPLKANQVFLDAGTVHQFQGSEADVVIFDLVDGVGRSSIGALLKGTSGRRLANVAITRARGKLILLADRVWCERVGLEHENSLLASVILGCAPMQRTQVVSARAPTSTAHSSTPIDPENPEFCTDRSESPIEARLRNAMLKSPVLAKLARQQVFVYNKSGRIVTRADFAFPDFNFAVFCDGRMWHAVEGRWQSDLRIGAELTELGWIYSRYSGRQINKGVEECVAQIERTLRSKFESFKASLGESWTMRLGDWKKAVSILRAFGDDEALARIGGHGHEHAHKYRIRVALERGTSISADVLADYPDLGSPSAR